MLSTTRGADKVNAIQLVRAYLQRTNKGLDGGKTEAKTDQVRVSQEALLKSLYNCEFPPLVAYQDPKINAEKLLKTYLERIERKLKEPDSFLVTVSDIKFLDEDIDMVRWLSDAGTCFNWLTKEMQDSVTSCTNFQKYLAGKKAFNEKKNAAILARDSKQINDDIQAGLDRGLIECSILNFSIAAKDHLNKKEYPLAQEKLIKMTTLINRYGPKFDNGSGLMTGSINYADFCQIGLKLLYQSINPEAENINADQTTPLMISVINAFTLRAREMSLSHRMTREEVIRAKKEFNSYFEPIRWVNNNRRYLDNPNNKATLDVEGFDSHIEQASRMAAGIGDNYVPDDDPDLVDDAHLLLTQNEVFRLGLGRTIPGSAAPSEYKLDDEADLFDSLQPVNPTKSAAEIRALITRILPSIQLAKRDWNSAHHTDNTLKERVQHHRTVLAGAFVNDWVPTTKILLCQAQLACWVKEWDMALSNIDAAKDMPFTQEELALRAYMRVLCRVEKSGDALADDSLDSDALADFFFLIKENTFFDSDFSERLLGWYYKCQIKLLNLPAKPYKSEEEFAAEADSFFGKGDYYSALDFYQKLTVYYPEKEAANYIFKIITCREKILAAQEETFNYKVTQEIVNEAALILWMRCLERYKYFDDVMLRTELVFIRKSILLLNHNLIADIRAQNFILMQEHYQLFQKIHMRAKVFGLKDTAERKADCKKIVDDFFDCGKSIEQNSNGNREVLNIVKNIYELCIGLLGRSPTYIKNAIATVDAQLTGNLLPDASAPMAKSSLRKTKKTMLAKLKSIPKNTPGGKPIQVDPSLLPTAPAQPRMPHNALILAEKAAIKVKLGQKLDAERQARKEKKKLKKQQKTGKTPAAGIDPDQLNVQTANKSKVFTEPSIEDIRAAQMSQIKPNAKTKAIMPQVIPQSSFHYTMFNCEAKDITMEFSSEQKEFMTWVNNLPGRGIIAMTGSQVLRRVLASMYKVDPLKLGCDESDDDYQTGYDLKLIKQHAQEKYGDKLLRNNLIDTPSFKLLQLQIETSAGRKIDIDVKYNEHLVKPVPNFSVASSMCYATAVSLFATADNVIHDGVAEQEYDSEQLLLDSKKEKQGTRDIKNCIIRPTLPIEECFQHDPSTILRMLKLWATLASYNFRDSQGNVVHPQWSSNLLLVEMEKHAKELLNNPSQTNPKLRELFFHNNMAAVELLFSSGIFEQIFPEFVSEPLNLLFGEERFFYNELCNFLAHAKTYHMTSLTMVYDFCLKKLRTKEEAEGIIEKNPLLKQQYEHTAASFATYPVSMLREINRALTFELPIQSRILTAMKLASPKLLAYIATGERACQEVNKALSRLFTHNAPDLAVRYLIDTQLLDKLFPEFAQYYAGQEIGAVLCEVIQKSRGGKLNAVYAQLAKLIPGMGEKNVLLQSNIKEQKKRLCNQLTDLNDSNQALLNAEWGKGTAAIFFKALLQQKKLSTLFPDCFQAIIDDQEWLTSMLLGIDNDSSRKGAVNKVYYYLLASAAQGQQMKATEIMRRPNSLFGRLQGEKFLEEFNKIALVYDTAHAKTQEPLPTPATVVTSPVQQQIESKASNRSDPGPTFTHAHPTRSNQHHSSSPMFFSRPPLPYAHRSAHEHEFFYSSSSPQSGMHNNLFIVHDPEQKHQQLSQPQLLQQEWEQQQQLQLQLEQQRQLQQPLFFPHSFQLIERQSAPPAGPVYHVFFTIPPQNTHNQHSPVSNPSMPDAPNNTYGGQHR